MKLGLLSFLTVVSTFTYTGVSIAALGPSSLVTDPSTQMAVTTPAGH